MRVLAHDLTFPQGWRGTCVIGGRSHHHPNLRRCAEQGHNVTRYTDDEPDALPRYRHNDAEDQLLVLGAGAGIDGSYCHEIDEWVGKVHSAEDRG